MTKLNYVTLPDSPANGFTPPGMRAEGLKEPRLPGIQFSAEMGT